MSTVAEDVLFLSLTDTDSIEILSTVGLDAEAIPTEEMRVVVDWAIERFFESGRTRAPSRESMLETWGQHIEDAGIELLPEDEDADTIQWAISTLKGQFVAYQHNLFLRASAIAATVATGCGSPTTTPPARRRPVLRPPRRPRRRPSTHARPGTGDGERPTASGSGPLEHEDDRAEVGVLAGVGEDRDDLAIDHTGDCGAQGRRDHVPECAALVADRNRLARHAQ